MPAGGADATARAALADCRSRLGDLLSNTGQAAEAMAAYQQARADQEALAAATGAPVEVDDGWLETDFGAWEGLSYAEAMERWPDEMTAWMADTSVAPPGGESFAATGDRVLAALDRLLGGREPGTVVVVSHVTPMKTVLRHALLAPPAALRRMYLDVACLCEVDWYADGPSVVRTFNDTAHLQPR